MSGNAAAFDPTLSEIRFGYGLSPRVPPSQSVDEMLTRLTGPDLTAAAFPMPGEDRALELTRKLNELRLIRRDQRGQPGYDAAHKAYRQALRQINRQRRGWGGLVLLRRAQGQDGFRERLVAFWGDHFSAIGKSALWRHWATPYVHRALRPGVSGRFADLLITATTHPLMLHYLDQASSFGPASRAAGRSKTARGLNENLAREVLELHSLGVDGPYSQEDVRQLAELFTGLGVSPTEGFVFRAGRAEPGPEDILGQTYGPRAGLGPIRKALTDLARHPATARHIARKLAVHFISDTPPEDLIAAMETAYLRHDTNLLPVYTALLQHPAAWAPTLSNVKPPVDYISSALRALDVNSATFEGLSNKAVRQLFYNPMQAMGQRWEQPAGPDGWPEADSAWVTPQGLAMRLRWALQAPERLLGELPEPEPFARTALGHYADERVLFAARAAETRAEAVGLIMSAPAFQRR